MQGCRIQLRLANILRQAVAWTSCSESVQLLAASGYQVAAVPAAGHAADRIPLMSGRLVWSELFRQPLSTARREVRPSHTLHISARQVAKDDRCMCWRYCPASTALSCWSCSEMRMCGHLCLLHDGSCAAAVVVISLHGWCGPCSGKLVCQAATAAEPCQQSDLTA